MSDASDFVPLFEEPLDVDDEGLRRERGSKDAVIIDNEMRLLFQQNRMALTKGKTLLFPGPEAGLVFYVVPLTCMVQSHPSCRFQWARVVVDLKPTPRAKVQDLSPREVRGDHPVTLETKFAAGLKFEVLEKVLRGEIKPEVSSSRTVYYPEIVSIGVGTSKAVWDFLALTSDYLHADRELYLLVQAPPGPLNVHFQLQAKVRHAGLVGLVPLIGRRKQEEAQVYRLN
jgi:hypothetical protein